jgi:predicted nucleic acid-binding protein
MKSIFADTHYWIALAIPTDQQHARAKEVTKALGAAVIVTTDEVLLEFLNFLSRYGPALRTAGVKLVRSVIANPNIQVVPQTRDSFLRGLELYESRSDKEYSLTDCISLAIMNDKNIVEVLTHDRHFSQEGKTLLL